MKQSNRLPVDHAPPETGPEYLLEGHTLLNLSIWAVVSLALHAITSYWASNVAAFVPAPYLDEVFHIRQAQAYCDGRLDQWDPKITTPPGLYLLSWVLNRAGLQCTTETLRKTNAVLLSFALLSACFLVLVFTAHNEHSNNNSSESASKSQATKYMLRRTHTSLNIALFPPLFFFSTLYYTDVGSTAFVLIVALLQHHPVLASYPILRGILLVVNGVLALLFRQTNVFWIGVFPAALDLVATLKRDASSPNYVTTRDSERPAFSDIARRSWVEGVVYDPPYDFAVLEDYFRVVLSIGIAAIAKISTTIRTLTPYLVLVTSFLVFVYSNGSVVLGDKSNHVATLHLPQMLYIWPCVVFFSFPLILPPILAAVIPSDFNATPFLGRYKSFGMSDPHYKRTVMFSIVALLSTLIVIYKNTIVHPFILADNRHYVFYVFRILLRHSSVRYIVAPVYIVCGWTALQAFCTPNPSPIEGEGKTTRSSNKDAPLIGETQHPVTASYVLIWLTTSAMSLVTAPLVEPRYFILPWIFWRLRIPGPRVQPIEEVTTNGSSLAAERRILETQNSVVARLRNLCYILDHGDHRLYFETLWFLAINAMTGYIFLHWGFEWPQEPGHVQRFMW